MQKKEAGPLEHLAVQITSVLAGTTIAYAICLLVMLGASALIAWGKLSAQGLVWMGCLAMALGGLIGGGYAVRSCRSRRLLVGLAVGGLSFCVWLVIGLWSGGVVLASGLWNLCGGLVGGGLAGFLAAGRQK